MVAIKRLIPNLLTAGNLVCGILAIITALTGGLEGLKFAPYYILIAAVLDFLDGFVARLLKVQSELGKQLDSLADMVTFGVAPGIILMILVRYAFAAFYTDQVITESTYYIVEFFSYSALIIPVFALFRLAKFNLDTRQTSSFIGLPTPAMTLYFAVIPLLIVNIDLYPAEWKNRIYDVLLMNPIFLLGSALIMSILMVSEIPLFALKFKDFKWQGNEVRYIFLTISLVLFATLLFWSVPLIIILYIILSIINNASKRKNEV